MDSGMNTYDTFLIPNGMIDVLTTQVFVVSPFGTYRFRYIDLSCLSTCMLVGNISFLPSIHGKHAPVSALSSADDKSIVD